MNVRCALSRPLLCGALLLPIASPLHAQATSAPPSDADLFRTVAALDRAVFDAYNACDLARFAAYFADDVEFYHDQSGLTRSRRSVVQAVRDNICGKVRRELVAGTLEVYPMHGYGALELGVHRFYHPGRESTEPVGEAKFVHLWQYGDGAWRITRVFSYDHHPLGEGAPRGGAKPREQ
jgi:uncharacterized protein (TIGR02246 family)